MMKNRDTPGTYRYRSLKQEHFFDWNKPCDYRPDSICTLLASIKKPQQQIEHDKHC